MRNWLNAFSKNKEEYIMEKKIQLPKLSDKMEEGTLVAWSKQVGETVKKGDALFEIETDKVVSEIESMEEGVLKEQFFAEGDKVKVGQVVAVLECIE